jgi:putative aldouronate transport system substrate-binding protein
MRKTRTWFALLLTVVMMLAMMAPVGIAQAAEKDYSQRMTVSIANVAPIEGYDYTAGDKYVKFWTDRYNVDVEIAGLTWDNWNEMLRIWISTQDMPDVAVFNFTTTTYPDAASFAEQGLLKKMPDDWRERWPNAAAVFDKTTLGPQLEKAFGGVFFLPRARFDVNLPGDPLPNHMSIHIRKDWAEAVGFPIKDAYKISELMEYARLIKEKDPGKLGNNLVPLAMKPEYAMRTFIYHNSTYYDTFYKDADGQYKWGFASDDTLEGLKLYYQAYKEGLLSPEFYSIKNEEDYDMFRISGVAGAAYMGGTSTGLQVDCEAKFGKSLGLDPKAAIQVANVLGEDGYYHQRDLINFWGALCFNPNIEDAKFERLMDWIDYACTPEGFLVEVAGFEGEDYKIENGQMVNLLPPGMPLEGTTGKYPGIGGYFMLNLKLWDDFSFDNPNVLPYYRDLSKKLYANRVEMGTPETFSKVDWTVYTHDSPARRKVAIDYKTELANLVTTATSVENLETIWRAYIDSQMPLIQPVLDELNAKAK